MRIIKSANKIFVRIKDKILPGKMDSYPFSIYGINEKGKKKLNIFQTLT